MQKVNKKLQKDGDANMFQFSKKSLERLKTCHPDIQKVMLEVIKIIDFTIIEGIRTHATQEEYVRTGKSKTLNSKHLPQVDGKSWAIDCAPFPIDWEDKERFRYFAGIVMGIAFTQGVKLRWGGDWNMNNDFKDQKFHDLPHFELIDPTPAPYKSSTDELLPPEPSQAEIDHLLKEIEDKHK